MLNFSKVLALFSYNKIKLNRYIFAKYFKINYRDNLTKKKIIFAGSSYSFVNTKQLFQCFFDFYSLFVVSFKVHFLFRDYMYDFHDRELHVRFPALYIRDIANA